MVEIKKKERAPPHDNPWEEMGPQSRVAQGLTRSAQQALGLGQRGCSINGT